MMMRQTTSCTSGDVQEDPAQRVPQQCQGWREIFFALREDWEFSDGSSREYGVPRSQNHGASQIDKRCNNLPRLYGAEVTRVKHIFSSVEEKGLYSVLALLEIQVFPKVMRVIPVNPKKKYPMVATLETARCLGIRLLELKFEFLEFELKLRSYGGIMAPTELKSDGREADHETHPSKGGGDRREASERRVTSSPTKKGEVIDSSKGKEEGTSTRAQKKMAATKSRNAVSSDAAPARKPWEGSSVNPDACLGPSVSFLASLSVTEKILSGVIPFAN
ncbi:hypothetical protein Acr_26g0004170 [Actinidia rufa]|uniref:Uncharacterized protein n=1 Tax=Actinidia rufa TaxID=165716 RepID=A0A7J0H230_9ERIC|nr:hypothetical protein Acr_26g0004170 [Actinidia rufa]